MTVSVMSLTTLFVQLHIQ